MGTILFLLKILNPKFRIKRSALATPICMQSLRRLNRTTTLCRILFISCPKEMNRKLQNVSMQQRGIFGKKTDSEEFNDHKTNIFDKSEHGNILQLKIHCVLLSLSSPLSQFIFKMGHNFVISITFSSLFS